jgi:hypothetical protein
MGARWIVLLVAGSFVLGLGLGRGDRRVVPPAPAPIVWREWRMFDGAWTETSFVHETSEQCWLGIVVTSRSCLSIYDRTTRDPNDPTLRSLLEQCTTAKCEPEAVPPVRVVAAH